MADEADIANDLMELAIKNKLKEISTTEVPSNDTGECLFCGEPVPDTRRWCCAECRDMDIRSRRA